MSTPHVESNQNYYKVTLPTQGDFEYIQDAVSDEEAEFAYQRLGQLLGIISDDILSILDQDSKALTITIWVYNKTVVPADKIKVELLEDFENPFSKPGEMITRKS